MEVLNWFPVLFPSGAIGVAERTLMINATLFMLIVAVPVFVLLFFFAWYYRAGNKKAKYMPDWEHAKVDELIWWAIPFEIVLILGALTWSSTHELDPKRPLEGAPPLVVQVVALEWKWLFIYPEQNIATINELAIPVGRPVRFEITADAPMNSFWIPKLGGQIYAMTGMTTTLHLIADEAGEFEGASANYSGEGFAHMKFLTKAVPPEEFDSWVMRTKASSRYLSHHEYEILAEKSIGVVSYYSGVEENLFNTIIAQFSSATSASVTEGKSWPSGPERPLEHSHE